MDILMSKYLRRNRLLPCNFCHFTENDVLRYGPMFTKNNITCHYFCILMSSKLKQNGEDNEGILGFLLKDLEMELRSSARTRCTFCQRTGATIFCCYGSCRLKFHFPCGVKHGVLYLFYDTFQSFCSKHRKNQTIPKSILLQRKTPKVLIENLNIKRFLTRDGRFLIKSYSESKPKKKKIYCFSVQDKCCICYESVVEYPLTDIFWPPCCKQNQWFHRTCLMKYSCSAGLYFIRCPLCNNKREFIDELYKFGIYIPSQDASWETERGAFSELTERPNFCNAKNCKCLNGRKYKKSRKWEILICSICGSEAIHRICGSVKDDNYECFDCVEAVRNIEKTQTNNMETEDIIDVDDIMEDDKNEILTSPANLQINFYIDNLVLDTSNKQETTLKSVVVKKEEDVFIDDDIDSKSTINTNMTSNCLLTSYFKIECNVSPPRMVSKKSKKKKHEEIQKNTIHKYFSSI